MQETENDQLSTTSVVTNFIKDEMHLNIKKDDIQSAERMGIQKTGDNKPRKIPVKFNNIWAKRDICRNKKILKDLPVRSTKNVLSNICKGH